jgi:hypothetical protein
MWIDLFFRDGRDKEKLWAEIPHRLRFIKLNLFSTPSFFPCRFFPNKAGEGV